MSQNQHQLLKMIEGRTVYALARVQLLQPPKAPPEPISKTNRKTCQPVQTAPSHEPSGTQMPWLFIQVPIKS